MTILKMEAKKEIVGINLKFAKKHVQFMHNPYRIHLRFIYNLCTIPIGVMYNLYTIYAKLYRICVQFTYHIYNFLIMCL